MRIDLDVIVADIETIPGQAETLSKTGCSEASILALASQQSIETLTIAVCERLGDALEGLTLAAADLVAQREMDRTFPSGETRDD